MVNDLVQCDLPALTLSSKTNKQTKQIASISIHQTETQYAMLSNSMMTKNDKQSEQLKRDLFYSKATVTLLLKSSNKEA